MSFLQTHQLVKCFQGVMAVDHLSVEFQKGRITSIIGPNGSGKTTLTNLLSGVTRFDAGTVVIGPEKMTRLFPYDNPVYGITRTFQEVRLFEQMSVLDNVLVVLTKRHVAGSLFERHTKLHVSEARALLSQAGLLDKEHSWARNLSYGQRKLLEIARALAMKAEMYLFDEPFAGMFPEMIKIVVAILEQLRRAGKTVVLIEHNMDLIRRLSDWVLVLDAGKLLAQGTAEEVLSRPDVVEAYLGG